LIGATTLALAIGLLGAAVPASATSLERASATWSNVAASPQPVLCSSVAYDAALHRYVTFGRQSDDTPETWTFDGSSWLQLQPTTSPTINSPGLGSTTPTSMAAAYDPQSSEVVLFGGQSVINDARSNKTWVLDGPTNNQYTWTDVSPQNPPSPRTASAMVWDSLLNKMVIFGGYGGSSGPNDLSDTWTLQNSNATWSWSQISTTSNPSARHSMAMAYDPAIGKVVLYGGSVYGNPQPLGDTWTFDGQNWVQVSTSSSPGPLLNASMVFDAADNIVILYGGNDGTNDNQQVWLFDGTNWTQATSSSGPDNAYGCNGQDFATDGTNIFYFLPQGSFGQQAPVSQLSLQGVTSPTTPSTPSTNTITEVSSSTTPASLARTGLDSRRPLLAGTAFVLLGAIAANVGRRRRSREARGSG
jgi:Galactose oxidase, central domain